MSDREQEQSGFRLTTKEKRQSEEEEQPQQKQELQVITNAGVDANARRSSLTGEDPTVSFNRPNIADGFRKTQVLVNDKGEEI
jgi:hypothetical protein